MGTSNDVYQRLREKLDALGFGFPESNVGDGEAHPEIDGLKGLFSPEDAEVFVAMRDGYQTAEEFASYSGYAARSAAERLYDMSQRGLLYRRGSDQGLEYRLVPFIHGILEFNVANIHDLSWFQHFAAYLGKSMFLPGMYASDTPFFRAVPYSADYVEDGELLPQDDIVSIINGMDDDFFGVADCGCRKVQKLAGVEQKHPLGTCMYTGDWARYAVEIGLCRRISREELLQLIAESERDGRIVQAINSEKPEALCSCDSSACLILGQRKARIPGASDAFRTNYYVVHDADACTGCGVCVDRCPVGVVGMGADGAVTDETAICMGCGLCVGTCPSGARKLRRKQQPYAPTGDAFDGYERQQASRGKDPSIFATS